MTNYPDEFYPSWKHYNGVEDKDDPELLQYVEDINYLKTRLIEGNLYVKFIDGDRKGAIARLEIDTKYKDRPCEVRGRYDTWKKCYIFNPESYSLYAIARWDKRSNKVQFHSHSNDYVFLPNYTGPTVWALFDKKAAKAEALKEPDQYDIDGKMLAIGDKVLYINARYGSAFELSHGVIKEFKASVDSRRTEIFTIVTNEEGVESKISSPETMIFKK